MRLIAPRILLMLAACLVFWAGAATAVRAEGEEDIPPPLSDDFFDPAPPTAPAHPALPDLPPEPGLEAAPVAPEAPQPETPPPAAAVEEGPPPAVVAEPSPGEVPEPAPFVDATPPAEDPAALDSAPRLSRPRKGFAVDEEETQAKWPGRYIGLRAAFGTGNTLVPNLSAPSFRSRGSVFEASPFFGLEFGYTPKQLGIAVTVEGTPLIPAPDFLSSVPFHLIGGVQLTYAYGSEWRFVAGFDPVVVFQTRYESDLLATLRGVGWRLGAHKVMGRLEGKPFEVFALLVGDYFREVKVTDAGGTSAVRLVGDYVDDGGVTSIVFLVGAQVNFSL